MARKMAAMREYYYNVSCRDCSEGIRGEISPAPGEKIGDRYYHHKGQKDHEYRQQEEGHYPRLRETRRPGTRASLRSQVFSSITSHPRVPGKR
jgi:hypothetical protein